MNAVPPAVLNFFHTGDLGDIIASLPIVRAIGAGNFIIGDVPMRHGLGRRQSMKGERYEYIERLIGLQPYIHSVQWQEIPTLVSHDFSTFRTTRNFHGRTIAEWQASYLHVSDVDYSPWLRCTPAKYSSGRVICARSPRYHEDEFPWRGIMDRVGERALFVGLPDEHKAFEDYTGRTVEHARTEDMLGVAQLIAGADLTVVNQTSTFWVAVGLGVPLIQETCRRVVDSVVLRENARYPMNTFDYQQILKSLDAQLVSA